MELMLSLLIAEIHFNLTPVAAEAPEVKLESFSNKLNWMELSKSYVEIGDGIVQEQRSRFSPSRSRLEIF